METSGNRAITKEKGLLWAWLGETRGKTGCRPWDRGQKGDRLGGMGRASALPRRLACLLLLLVKFRTSDIRPLRYTAGWIVCR